MHEYVSKLGYHWLRKWFDSCSAPVTLYRDPTALERRFEISQSTVGPHENTNRKYGE